jgi:hypothetical protein
MRLSTNTSRLAILSFLLPLTTLAGMDSIVVWLRQEASQGHWKEVDAKLKSWNNDPRRREGGGEVLFWQGWAALHQHRRDQADTLFTLASAYVGEAISQRALEYRYAVLLDSGEALYAYVRGLPESPLPDSSRKLSLGRIPAASPLYAYGLWERSLISKKDGDKYGELAVLRELAKNPSTLAGRLATARLALLRFEPDHPDSAMAAYERLLLQYQQGVPSEFAKSRVQAMRNKAVQKSQ